MSQVLEKAVMVLVKIVEQMANLNVSCLYIY